MNNICNSFGLYSDSLNSLSQSLHMNVNLHTTHTPELYDDMSQCILEAPFTSIFTPFCSPPQLEILSSCPPFLGNLKLFHKDGSPFVFSRARDGAELDFSYEADSLHLCKKTNYHLPFGVQPVSLSLRIHKPVTHDKTGLGMVEILGSNDKKYYYVFSPNILFSYDSGPLCLDNLQTDPIVQELRDELSSISDMAQDLEFYEGFQSFTINKKDVYLCVKDHKDEYYDKNFLRYVAIHELAHAHCDEIGHTPKFYRIMDELLEKAEELGFYDPKHPRLHNYCSKM